MSVAVVLFVLVEIVFEKDRQRQETDTTTERLLSASWSALGVGRRKRTTPTASLEESGSQRDVVDVSPSSVARRRLTQTPSPSRC